MDGFSGGGRMEYILAAYPDEKVQEKIAEESREFRRLLGNDGHVESRPYISVSVFRAPELMEDTLIRWIRKICTSQQGFVVTLNNYGGFPPHHIYLRVLDHLPFTLLEQQMKSIGEYMQDAGDEVQYRRPHLNILERLPADAYRKALFECSQRSFHESFRVDELVLIRREDAYDTFRAVNIFRFLPPADSSLIEVA